MASAPNKKLHPFDIEAMDFSSLEERLAAIYAMSVHHHPSTRGAGFIMDAMARGFTVVEAEFLTKAAGKLPYTTGDRFLCYHPATVVTKYPTTHKKLQKTHPRFYVGNLMFPGAKLDRWWVYDMHTGEWNPDWKRP